MELWQRGGIRLFINRESQSFAQRYHTEHGLSVCAYGLSCPDVPGLLERATKLGYLIEYADPEHDTHGIAVITGPTQALWSIQTIPLRIGSESLFIMRSIQTHIYPEWIM